MRLLDQHVLLGVTGGIAAYKACEVLRRLKREGTDVRVVMTHAAREFVGPLTFETLSGNEVITELFPRHRVVKTRHISVAEWADCLLICPATANVIGKVASGVADDFLTTVVMASRAPVVFAPAMDYQMVQNPIYLSNCKKLQNLGYSFVVSEEGELASGAVGPGRLADYHRIMDGVKMALFGSDKWKGKRILITAGPTRESLDPVRYLTNHSSGKMGYALAEEAALRGAEVTLVSGPTSLEVAQRIERIQVCTAQEMGDAILDEWEKNDVLIMTAAVADFRPSETSHHKIKKGEGEWNLHLEPTTDILRMVAEQGRNGIVVGFALETENGENFAKQKLLKKKLDLICLNNPLEAGSGFGEDTNRVILIDRDGKTDPLPLMPKWEVAQKILDKVDNLLNEEGEI